MIGIWNLESTSQRHDSQVWNFFPPLGAGGLFRFLVSSFFDLEFGIWDLWIWDLEFGIYLPKARQASLEFLSPFGGRGTV